MKKSILKKDAVVVALGGPIIYQLKLQGMPYHYKRDLPPMQLRCKERQWPQDLINPLVLRHIPSYQFINLDTGEPWRVIAHEGC